MTSKKIGILGTGQLGRMAALAAARLGLEVHIFGPEGREAPAAQVVRDYHAGDYTDELALRAFATQVDAITYEFENVPAHTAHFLNAIKPVYPSPAILEMAQDRILEKQGLQNSGLATTRFVAVTCTADIEAAMTLWASGPAILKTTRFGYDGKGQTTVRTPAEALNAIAKLAPQGTEKTGLILEERVDFLVEASVIVARDQHGHVDAYAPALNEHREHILYQTTAPAPLDMALLKSACDLAKKLATALNLVGVLGVELFLTRDSTWLVNEIAPRPHNSGHWTMDACICSQFEQHMRAVAGLPLGSCAHHSQATMTNILGAEWLNMAALAADPANIIHDYGKKDPKAGRKMGHINRLTPLASAR